MITVHYVKKRGVELTPPPTPPTPQPVTLNYTASNVIIPNPERGWFQYTETHYVNGGGHTPLSDTTLANNRTTLGQAYVFRYFVIEDLLNTDTVPTAYLNNLAGDFNTLRTAGCKAVIRFAYSTSGDMTAPYGADPAPARVLTHIDQLGPTLAAHSDVVDAIQSGFVGMWGEQYYTDNFGDVGNLTEQNWTDRLNVLNRLLDVTEDTDTRILVRYPGMKKRWFNQ